MPENSLDVVKGCIISQTCTISTRNAKADDAGFVSGGMEYAQEPFLIGHSL